MADNFHFDMTGVPLEKALEIAFMNASGGKAEAMAVHAVGPDHRVDRLVLYWLCANDNARVTPLPAPMTAEQVAPMVRAWLDATDYGPQPDHDGDNERGHRVYCEAWGHIARDPYAFVAIEPAWLMYGK